MSNFVSNYCLGPIAPMVQSDKGNFRNKVDCTKAQTKEFGKTMVKAAAISAPVVATGHFIANTGTSNFMKPTAKKAQTVANKLFEKVYTKASELVKKGNVKEVLKDLVKDVKNASPTKKGGMIVLAGLSLVAMTVAMIAGHKHMYNMGQIDQKYTDKAENQAKKPPYYPTIVY